MDYVVVASARVAVSTRGIASNASSGKTRLGMVIFAALMFLEGTATGVSTCCCDTSVNCKVHPHRTRGGSVSAELRGGYVRR